jgi:hypothetical protein
MKEFIAANGGLIATSALAMISINLVLSGLKAGLEKIKDKTATTVDNKVYDIVNTVSGFLSKILDVIGYNPEHK